MNAVLICPSDRPGVAWLAECQPLALTPLLGRSVLDYWIEALAARGVKRIFVLAHDRPHLVRAAIGDGSRWGVRIEVQPQSRELTVEEARAKFSSDPENSATVEDVVLLDRLPGLPDFPLFESYAGWFSAVQAWAPHARLPTRIGVREIQPGIAACLGTRISPDARLIAPVWLGENVTVSSGAVVGPHAYLDDGVVVEEGARVTGSIVHPNTFVGRHVSVENSLAAGSTLVNWQTGSRLEVPDDFLLAPLAASDAPTTTFGVFGRVLAIFAMVATMPVALVAMVISLARGEAPLRLRIAVRCGANWRARNSETFAYYELASAGNWLRRWPQFWSVARGDLRWIGNRPLRPTQAFSLSSDFERLWLASPPGLISLADASGCPEGVSADACAHASYYAVNVSRGLDARIAGRALFRAAFAWPLYWTARRREHAESLSDLAEKTPGRV